MHLQTSFTIFVTLYVSGCAVNLQPAGDIPEEHEVFDSILRSQQSHRTYTPRKCCKVGMRVAEVELDCDVSYDVIEDRNNNVAYRGQLKPELSSASSSRRLHFKNLLYSVEKCNPSEQTRSMFLKCCGYQKDLMRAVLECDELSVQEERQECQRLARRRRK